jgi:hypothetical protein
MTDPIRRADLRAPQGPAQPQAEGLEPLIDVMERAILQRSGNPPLVRMAHGEQIRSWVEMRVHQIGVELVDRWAQFVEQDRQAWAECQQSMERVADQLRSEIRAAELRKS